ncbi:MAG: tRNA-binding protein [Synergistales bacterium]|jgi:tRNA-binding protein
MSTELKPVVSKEDTFDRLEIRLGRILSAEIEPSSPKKAYRIVADFGKFGKKTSVGRFTLHSPEELVGHLVVAVLNFEPRQVGETVSEVLVLGVQYPKADSGEATFLTPAEEAKIGGKVF